MVREDRSQRHGADTGDEDRTGGWKEKGFDIGLRDSPLDHDRGGRGGGEEKEEMI